MSNRMIVWLLPALLLAAGCGPRVAAQDAARLHPGDRVRLVSEGSAPVWVYRDQAANDEALKCARANDTLGLKQLGRSARVLITPAGTAGVILDDDPAWERVELRLLSGAHAGESGWVPASQVSRDQELNQTR